MTTDHSIYIQRLTATSTLALTVGMAAACGGAAADPSSTGGALGNGGAAGSSDTGEGAMTSATDPGKGVTGGATATGGDTETGGAPTEMGATCEAGSAVQGGGADACSDLPWRCVDASVGNPPTPLQSAECSTGHTGACCNYGDKCLTNTDGSPGSQSAVEVALGPCQVGCITNPSAQACLDCINTTLTSAGMPTLSDGCGACWAGLISCSFTRCLELCLAGADAPECRQCAFSECVVGPGKFNECSGLASNGGL